MSRPEAIAYLRQQADAPSEMRTAEWDRVPVAVRERSFFMAGVDNAETLQLFRDQAEKIAAGKQTTSGARLAIRDELQRRGYRPEPGTEGTIRDLSSVQRLNVALDTNVRMARGYGAWLRQQKTIRAFPAWRYIRGQQRKEPRDWPARWARARAATIAAGSTDPYSDGGMVALINHPLWSDRDFNRFGTPYTPFDYHSGMMVTPVSRSEARELGLLPEQYQGEDRDAASEMMQPRTRGLNHELEARPAVTDPDLRDGLERHLGGLAVWDGDVLRFVPAGERPRPVTIPDPIPQPRPQPRPEPAPAPAPEPAPEPEPEPAPEPEPEPTIIPPEQREQAILDMAARVLPDADAQYVDTGSSALVRLRQPGTLELDFYVSGATDPQIKVDWMASRDSGAQSLRGIDALIELAERIGTKRITADAARSVTRDGRTTMNGYKMWPKLGFDGPLPQRMIDQLPPDLAGARTVLDLYDSPAGRRYWIENGDTYNAAFDLEPNSRSRRVLANIKAKLARRSRPAS